MPTPRMDDLALFSGLDQAARAVVRAEMTRLSLSAGAPLFVQGDAAARFFVLLDGRLKVSQVTEDGRQMIVRIVHPGELCGFAQALGRDRYPGSAEAIVNSLVLAWPTARWQTVIGAAPSLSMSAIEAIGRKLDEAHTRLREIATQEAGARIAHLLLRLVRKTGQQNGRTIEIPFPLSRQDIADMTGCTLHTVSRIMAAWETQGVLARARRKVVIADMNALADLVTPG